MAQETVKKVSIKPLGNRILVQRIESKETTKGGIILPETAQQKKEMAKVIAVGTGSRTKENQEIPIPVAVGETILLDKYAGQEVTLDDEEYLIVRVDDVIAVVKS